MRVAANVRLDSSLDRLVTSHVKGPVAQLGERYTGSVEVVGSIPIGSTFLFAENQSIFNRPFGCAASRTSKFGSLRKASRLETASDE